MKFLEQKAKEIFARYGIPVPRGVVASRAEEIADPPLPCMVKAQVLVGGRGKAGGIRPANSLEEARAVARQILGLNIGGYTVKQLYLADRLDVENELYLSYSIDRTAREALLMSTPMGGVEIEALPREKILMECVPVLIGPQPYLWRVPLEKPTPPADIGGHVRVILRQASRRV